MRQKNSTDFKLRKWKEYNMEQHPMYETWRWIVRMSFKNAIPENWKTSITAFLNDVGDKPAKEYQLRRRNADLPYSKENCYWKPYRTNADKALAMREWVKKNPEKVKNNDLKKSHGITLNDYNSMFEKQGGVCAICKQPEKAVIKGKILKLAVDHCHSSNKIRGLLCTNCNTGLGLFRDSKESLDNAIKYLST